LFTLRRMSRRWCGRTVRKSVDNSRLRAISPAWITDIFRLAQTAAEWPDVSREIDGAIAAPGLANGKVSLGGSINAGDRRAIYSLIRALKPHRILEIGTHIGGSTLSIAAAMRRNKQDGAGDCSLTSVDSVDVNGAPNAYWKRIGFPRSPRENIAAFGMSEHVSFVTADSRAYFQNCRGSFDFAFIDGDHSAEAVHQDVTSALRHLHHEGIILLHDYFPNKSPLWSNGKAIPGPYMAVEQLRREGAALEAIPLGALPWPTKLESKVTSLAILSRTG
jgi:predicted O-methyltransferase YrrM